MATTTHPRSQPPYRTLSFCLDLDLVVFEQRQKLSVLYGGWDLGCVVVAIGQRPGDVPVGRDGRRLDLVRRDLVEEVAVRVLVGRLAVGGHRGRKKEQDGQQD